MILPMDPGTRSEQVFCLCTVLIERFLTVVHRLHHGQYSIQSTFTMVFLMHTKAVSLYYSCLSPEYVGFSKIQRKLIMTYQYIAATKSLSVN